ncbi:MAG TPA: ATP synthase F1 subunit epsilon [Spirochaetota bacterium]|nr:ATP synthase F1 subunit epsilon [Spirochaetota bacterium]
MSMKLQCTILMPDRILYEGDVHFAVVQAYDGETGFLYNHAPFVSELGTGEVRLRIGELTEFFMIEGGFVEINDNKLVILAENAYTKADLIKDEIEREMAAVQAKEPKDYKEGLLVRLELTKLKARLKVASR